MGSEETLLLSASTGNLIDLITSIDEILNASSNIETKDKDGNTAFLLASKNGHAIVVETLRDRGADINAQNSANETFLHLAVKYDHQSIVESVLIPETQNVTIDAKDIFGRTPLITAAMFGHKSIANLLIK